MGTLVRTKNFFIAISLVKLNHSHRKYSRKRCYRRSVKAMTCVPSELGSYPLDIAYHPMDELLKLCNSLKSNSPCLHKLIVHIFKFEITMQTSHSSHLTVLFSKSIANTWTCSQKGSPPHSSNHQMNWYHSLGHQMFWNYSFNSASPSDHHRCDRYILKP